MFKALCVNRETAVAVTIDDIKARDKRSATFEAKLALRQMGYYACKFTVLVEDKRHA